MAGRRRALLLANAAYADRSGYAPLNAPPTDARSLEEILKDPARGAFDDVVRLDEPTRAEMLRAAKQMLGEAGPDDVVLLYYSGHGDVDLDGSLFLVASDTEKGYLESTGVETETLSRMIQRAVVGRTVLILDCCHAGAFVIPGAKSGEDVLQTRLDDYARGSGTYMLMATSGRDVATDGPPGGLSVLTRHVVEGLGGPADEDRDGTISVSELSRYLDRQMARHESQRFLESGLNRQGDVLLAWSGIDREAELIPRIRAKLFDWRQQDAIASDVLSKALAILETSPEALDEVEAARRKLLFDTVEKNLASGMFLHWWYYARRRHGDGEDDGRTMLHPQSPFPSPEPTRAATPATAQPTVAGTRSGAAGGRDGSGGGAPQHGRPSTAGSAEAVGQDARAAGLPLGRLASCLAGGAALGWIGAHLWRDITDGRASYSENIFFTVALGCTLLGALVLRRDDRRVPLAYVVATLVVSALALWLGDAIEAT